MAHVITNECLACGACADTCPVGAIVLDEAKGIYVINGDCVDCGACAEARYLYLAVRSDDKSCGRNASVDNSH